MQDLSFSNCFCIHLLYMYKMHRLYSKFVVFVILVIFLDYCVYIYIFFFLDGTLVGPSHMKSHTFLGGYAVNKSSL